MIDFKKAEKSLKENKKEVVEKLANFSLTDVLLFLSPNEKIRKVQAEKWLPVLQWLNNKFNLALEKTESLTPPEGNEKNLQILQKMLESLSLKKFTAFYLVALRLKSPLLALAYVENKISIEQAFELAFLEEFCQNQEWGVDKEAEESRNALKSELCEVDRYFKL